MANDLEGWLEAVVSGQASMSQRGVRWAEAQGGLYRVVAAAKTRGFHLVRLTDDAGKVLIAASLHPFEALLRPSPALRTPARAPWVRTAWRT